MYFLNTRRHIQENRETDVYASDNLSFIFKNIRVNFKAYNDLKNVMGKMDFIIFYIIWTVHLVGSYYAKDFIIFHVRGLE